MSMNAAVYDQPVRDDSRTVLPGQILRSLSRRWFLLLVCGLLGAVLGLAGASQMIRTFTASGDLVIDEKAFAIPELQGAISGQGSPDVLPAVRTAAIDLRSEALLESVVTELQLTKYSYFNPDLRQPTLVQLAIGQVAALVPSLFPTSPKRPGQETALAALELANRLTIFYDNRSLVVTASVVLPDPELAARIVNAVLKRYIAVQGDSRVQYNTAANADITRHLGEVRAQVDALDAAARDLRAKNDLVTISPSGSLGQQRLSELGTQQARASADLQQLQAKLNLALQLTQQGKIAELADVLSSQTISRLRDQEGLTAQRLAKLDATVLPDSRLRIAAQAEHNQVKTQIAAESNRIVKSLGEQVAAERDRVKAATQALDTASAAAAKASLVQANITQVEKEAESRRQVYQALLERASQTAVSPEVARQSPGVYIGSPAVVPVFPSGPHTKIVAALGMVAGLMAGCVVAVKRGKDAPLSATPEEIALHTHLPLLGVIPLSTRRQMKLADGMQPRSSAEQDEALALLYSRLRHHAAQRGAELRSLLFIGADGEDTSAIAQSFAAIAGREGERVLLIDTYSGGQSNPVTSTPAYNETGGLTAVLDGQRAWREELTYASDSSTNLLPLPARSIKELDQKAATRFRSMLREAADDYTLIVVASRWNARSVQASQLIQTSDFTVLIVNPRKARPSAVTAAVDHLSSLKSSLGLAVLSRHVG